MRVPMATREPFDCHLECSCVGVPDGLCTTTRKPLNRTSGGIWKVAPVAKDPTVAAADDPIPSTRPVLSSAVWGGGSADVTTT
jgi:hypothetical protein